MCRYEKISTTQVDDELIASPDMCGNEKVSTTQVDGVALR